MPSPASETTHAKPRDLSVLHLLGADEDTGGILSVLRNLDSATAKHGCRHVVWVNAAYKETRSPPLRYRHSRYLLAESPNHLLLSIRAFAAAGELRRLLRSESFDILHAHSRGAFPLVTLLALRGKDVLFTNHAYARRTWMYRWAARRRHFHTCCLTPNMARHYAIPPNAPRLHVISACCSDRFFALPLVDRPRTPLGGRPIRIVGLGNIVRWKNWHLVLEALNLLEPDDRNRVELDHWGPTPADPDSQAYRAELDEMVRRHGLSDRCRFHGALLSVEKALADADWFVIPSTNEPCSVALMEALAMGLPAIASATGGNVDIVQRERTGLLFEPDSAVALAECLRRILAREVNISDREFLRESVRHRSASSVGEQYLELYDALKP